MQGADDGGARGGDDDHEEDRPAGEGEASFGELEGEEIQLELAAPAGGCSCHRPLAPGQASASIVLTTLATSAGIIWRASSRPPSHSEIQGFWWP